MNHHPKPLLSEGESRSEAEAGGRGVSVEHLDRAEHKKAAWGDEAAELARHLGAVAKECNLIIPFVLSLKYLPPEVAASAERIAAWLDEVRPPNETETETVSSDKSP